MNRPESVRSVLLSVLSVLTAITVLAAAETADAPTIPVDAAAAGRRIAEEMKRRDAGFGDSLSEATMVLIDRAGGEVRRQFRFSILEDVADAPRSLIVFREPRDIAGTALLAHAHRDRDEDQWLHLPALRRTKRIAVRGRTGAFVGSEFSYEDLVPWALERWTYVHRRDEAFDGRPCHVVEMRPVYADSGYRRQEAWIDQERFQPVRIDSFDLQDRPLKSLRLDDWKRYLDRHWRPQRLRMSNAQSGAATTIDLSPYVFRSGLTAADFTDAAMARAVR